ncbi:MAG: hypothetical protein Q7R49_03775 [Candidatus Daviesbacteria bacterium]|nr:hypothetical protein [Candidatus Daviesbacteria bacterium]
MELEPTEIQKINVLDKQWHLSNTILEQRATLAEKLLPQETDITNWSLREARQFTIAQRLKSSAKKISNQIADIEGQLEPYFPYIASFYKLELLRKRRDLRSLEKGVSENLVSIPIAQMDKYRSELQELVDQPNKNLLLGKILNSQEKKDQQVNKKPINFAFLLDENDTEEFEDYSYIIADPKIDNQLSELDKRDRRKITNFLQTTKAHRILTRIANFKPEHDAENEDFQRVIIGHLFEGIAYQFLKDQYEQGQTVLLSPDEVLLVYQNAYPDLAPSSGSYNLARAIKGISNPDGFLIQETADALELVAIFEYKNISNSQTDLARILKQSLNFTPRQVNQDLKLDENDDTYSEFLGSLIAIIKPQLSSKPFRISSSTELVYITPSNSRLKVPNSKVQRIGLRSTYIHYLNKALMEIVSPALPEEKRPILEMATALVEEVKQPDKQSLALLINILQMIITQKQQTIEENIPLVETPQRPVKKNLTPPRGAKKIIKNAAAVQPKPNSTHESQGESAPDISALDGLIEGKINLVLEKKMPVNITFGTARNIFPQIADIGIASGNNGFMKDDEQIDLATIAGIIVASELRAALSKEEIVKVMERTKELMPETPKKG